MSYLLDTNVVSELRRGRKCDPTVRTWAVSVENARHYISVLSLGEIRKGIESLRPKSPRQSAILDRWVEQLVLEYDKFILPVNQSIAERWGRLNAIRSIPVIDGLLAATALEWRLTVATRNTGDFPGEVPVVNPWAAPAPPGSLEGGQP